MAIRSGSPENPQLDLLGGVDAKPAEIHRLFFALVPDDVTRAQLGQAAEALKARHPGLHARWVNPSRYHATLHFLGDNATLRQDVVDAAIVAAGKLRAAPFAWTLHHAASFHGRQPPCVLRSSTAPEPMQQLWQDLRLALIRAGQGGHIERSITPHVTVAYSHGQLLDVTPIEPVTWMVEEFALIHSIVGQPDCQMLACWPLQLGESDAEARYTTSSTQP